MEQDGPLWPFSPTSGFSIWIALDEVTMDNGAMSFFPASHKLGGLEHESTTDNPDDVNGNAIPDSVMDEVQTKHEQIAVELTAGACSIHSELLVHGSLPNTSERRRLAVTISYLKPSSHDLGLGWNTRYGMHVAGGDPSGHWCDLPRPPAFAP